MIQIDMRGRDTWQTKENNFRMALLLTRMFPNWRTHGAIKHIRDNRRAFRKAYVRTLS